jgi:hypothetical protein
MVVASDGGCAGWQDARREAAHIHHAALDMIVGVDESGYQESSVCIDDLCVLTHPQMVTLSHKCNDSVSDSYIHPFLDAGYIDIYQAAIPDDQIRRFPSHGSCNDILRNLV